MSGVITHDWISPIGGSEKVLDSMVEAFPDAEVWCLWNDDPATRYPERVVRESWIARTPLRRSKAMALPLMPPTWRHRRVGDADWVLASSHLFAHHVRVRDPEVKKFAYVYTPARYIWYPSLDERGQGLLPRLASPALRAVDRRRAQEPFRLAGISEYVCERIQVAWDREADVIYPPVEVGGIVAGGPWSDRLQEAEADVLERIPKPFLLGASRFIPYKRLDKVIETGEAARLPVVLAGSGPEGERLRQQASEASVPVFFVHDPSDRLLYALYEAALAFVFLAVEDFGIMPVEAMAAGTPVVVRNVGGASETVLHGQSGAHVPVEAGRVALADAVHTADSCDAGSCRQRASSFDRPRFMDEIRGWVRRGEGDVA